MKPRNDRVAGGIDDLDVLGGWVTCDVVDRPHRCDLAIDHQHRAGVIDNFGPLHGEHSPAAQQEGFTH